MTTGVHGPRRRRRRSRRSAAAYVSWLPFVCMLAAIVLVAGSAISWVISPNWGLHNAIAPARNIGDIPTVHTSPVALQNPISPDRIEIPKLKTNAPIFPITTDAGGGLEPPLNPLDVGWWENGAKPGAARGTAIVTGHINYAGVEGAMARIGTLNPGDLVYIYGINAGKKVKEAFKITGVRTYIKTALPYQEIFSQESVGRLALVTCGGPFDANTGNYLDNIVAFAVPA